MTSPLLTLPPDLQLRIISQFDSVDDITSLDLTCHHFHSFLANAGPILRDIGSLAIPCFSDALRVTRAKLLPRSLLQHSVHFDLSTNTYTKPLNSDFFRNLSVSPPTVSEAAKTRRIFDVAVAWEVPTSYDGPSRPLPHEAYFRAAFRYMLFGVVYSHAILYPLELVENEARSYGGQDLKEWVKSELARYPPWHADVDLRTEMMEVLYSGFGTWLAEDARSRARETAGEENITAQSEYILGRRKPLTAEERAVLKDVMLLYSFAAGRDMWWKKVEDHDPRDIENHIITHNGSFLKFYRHGGFTTLLYHISSSSCTSGANSGPQTRALVSEVDRSLLPRPGREKEEGELEITLPAHDPDVDYNCERTMLQAALKQHLNLALDPLDPELYPPEKNSPWESFVRLDPDWAEVGDNIVPASSYFRWLSDDLTSLGVAPPLVVGHVVELDLLVKYMNHEWDDAFPSSPFRRWLRRKFKRKAKFRVA